MKPIVRRSSCAISYTMDIFGDKWTLLILRDLLFAKKDSFSDFKCSDEKIATNILTDRLNMLVQEGFVTKHISPLNKSKFLYRPTEKALEIIPILSEILLWAEKYNPDGAPENFIVPLKKDKKKAILNIRKEVEEHYKRREL